MILELFLIIGPIILTSLFWAYIVDFVSRIVIPFVREKLGEQTAAILTDLMLFLNKKMVFTNRMIMRFWEGFRATVIGIISIFTKTSSDKVEVRAETYIKTEDAPLRQVIKEEISWAEVPLEVREKMIKYNSDSVKLDDSRIIEEKFRQRCKEEGILIQEMR